MACWFCREFNIYAPHGSAHHSYSRIVSRIGRIELSEKYRKYQRAQGYIEMEPTQQGREKKLTLLLLCWLFGLFSVHRFYTGKYFSGGLQLFAFLLAGMF